MKVARNRFWAWNRFISFLPDKQGSLILDAKTNLKGQYLNLPIIGLGTFKIPDEAMEGAITAAIESGYRHIDAAYLHNNEAAIGKVLNKLLQGKVKRSDIFVTSKLPHFGMKPDDVKTFIYRSLHNLQLSYLDLYLIQFPVGVITDKPSRSLKINPKTDHIGVWQALEEQYDEGYVRAIGVSNFSKQQLDDIIETCVNIPTNVQMEMHVYCQQEGLRKYCSERDIVVSAYAPLGSPGLLHYSLGKGSSQKVQTPLNDRTVIEIAKAKGKTPAQILLRFILQQGVAVIPKSSNPEHIKANIEVFNFSLTEKEMNELKKLDKGESGRVYGHNVWTYLSQSIPYPFPDSRPSR